MDRVSRFVNNRKQDKVRLSNTQPSVNSMREGEEVFYNDKNGLLCRYRKQNGKLWKSSMSSDGNGFIDGNLNVKKDISISGNLRLKNVPVFEACRASSNQLNLAVGSDVLIEMNGSNIESGHFDTSTYLFTAPLNGIYLMYFNIALYGIDVDMSYAHIFLKDSSAAQHGAVRIDDNDFSTDTDTISKVSTKIIQMTAGTTLGVYYYQSGGSAQVDVYRTGTGFESVFGGYLITKL